MIDIRLLTKLDMEDAKRLWSFDFETDEPFLSWYFSDFLVPENSVGLFLDNTLIAMLQLNPYRISIGNTSFDTSYIVGVITHPTHRNKGYINQLMDFAYREMLRRNQHVAILMPFDTLFYKKYGLELCYSQQKFVLPTSTLKAINCDANISRLEITQANNCVDLYIIYKAFTHKLNGYIVRSEFNWRSILSDLFCYKGRCFVFYENNQPVGYVMYTVTNNKMRIVDIAYISTYYEHIIYAEIAKLSRTETFDKVMIPASASNQSVLWLKDTISPEPTNAIMSVPFMTGRLLSVVDGFSKRRFDAEGSFSIRVTDSMIDHNNGVFEFHFNNKRCIVNRRTDCAPDFSIDIGVLSQLFFHGISFAEAVERRLIDVHSSHKMDLARQVFVKMDNYINEYF